VSETHSLTLRNDPVELVRMMAWIDELVAKLGLSEQAAYALRLCLEEAVANVVNHAFEPGAAHDIHVAVWRDEGALSAEVMDDGRPFDPLAHESSPVPKDLQSAPVGGLGIKLMRGFASQIRYRRSGGMNRLSFTFAMKTPAEPPLKEIGGPSGPEPTRYGDWEVNGRCTDF
jgi:serine/threonine-protein kinase RsbW/sigma-B regulation protein RsbU (phosphoserine phosphatase)